jgi:hypothetical protein
MTLSAKFRAGIDGASVDHHISKWVKFGPVWIRPVTYYVPSLRISMYILKVWDLGDTFCQFKGRWCILLYINLWVMKIYDAFIS